MTENTSVSNNSDIVEFNHHLVSEQETRMSESGSSGSHDVGASTSNSSSTAAGLASLFECPICFDYVLPPILQCQNGHLVCSKCRPRIKSCPTCRRPLENIRNLAMEKVALTVMFPCKYSSSGCPISILYTKKVEHEDLCEFRPYTCPYTCPRAPCEWQGNLEQVMGHLKVSHKSITTLQGENINFLVTDINLATSVDWVMMQLCFGHNFMFVLEKKNQKFFAMVYLIGSQNQCENFTYRLELNKQKNRLAWENIPKSIHEGVRTAIPNSKCIIINASTAQMFAHNGNLKVNVTISTNA